MPYNTLEKTRAYRERKREHINKIKKMWLQKNPDKLKAMTKRYYDKHRDKLIIKSREYSIKNPQKPKTYKRKYQLKRYNITLDQYNEMFNKQEGKCAICKKHQNEINKTLCVDHNHKTNAVRQLLCHTCNVTLSYFENYDNKPFLEYLNKHRKDVN
jgi:hypothetical protein